MHYTSRNYRLYEYPTRKRRTVYIPRYMLAAYGLAMLALAIATTI